MIEEAVSHTPLEALFAKELDKVNEKIRFIEIQMPKTLAQKMESISKISNWNKNDI